MTDVGSVGNPGFDRYAVEYEEALARGLVVSGEDSGYFVQGRLHWLSRCLGALGVRADVVLDFGCGTGNAVPAFFERLNARAVIGVDPSTASLAVARKKHDRPNVAFYPLQEYMPKSEVDLAFCNGVFHHIQPADRHAAVEYIFRALRPDGVFAFWENNPWSPAARYVMSRIPFDRDAVLVKPAEARRLLASAGFEIVRTDYRFVFPRWLRWFRTLEDVLAPFPTGAQYQVLCRKPF